MTDFPRTAQRPATPTSTSQEQWHQNGLCPCEVIVTRPGPAPDGTRYADGRHAIRVAVFESEEDAREAVGAHNSPLVPTWPDYTGLNCGY